MKVISLQRCYFFIIIFSYLLTGCKNNQSIPINLPSISPTLGQNTISPIIATATTTPQPTKTPIPTNPVTPTKTNTITPTQTNTPYPTLSQSGPFLTYLKNNTLIILNSNGQGRSELKLPENAYITNLKKAISPNGKWIVIYLGKPDKYGGLEFTSELSINLLYIPDGSIHRISNLFPENQDIFPTSSDFGNLFAYEWSPDGTYLAFAGVMDRPNIQLYIYNIEKKVITRLTDDLVNIWYINWSPDEKWIWFESLENVPISGLISLYTIKFDGSTKFKPTFWSKSLWTEGDWITPSFYFLISSTDGGDCPLYNLRYIDVATGEKTELWGRLSNTFAIDKKNKLLAVSTECEEQGTFLVDWFGKMYVKISETPLAVVPWTGRKYSFLGIDYKGYQVFGINHFGAMTLLSEKDFDAVSESPDNQWFVLYQDPHYSHNTVVGIDLFSENNQFIRTISGQYTYPVAWTPDSTGLFFFDGSLYYISIPNGNPILIDDCKPDGCTKPFVWIP